MDCSFAAYCLAATSVALLLIAGMNVWTGITMDRALRELNTYRTLNRNMPPSQFGGKETNSMK